MWHYINITFSRHWFLSSNRTRIYSRMWHFFECHPTFFNPCKNPCDTQKCHPFNWPIRLRETNMRYNNQNCHPANWPIWIRFLEINMSVVPAERSGTITHTCCTSTTDERTIGRVVFHNTNERTIIRLVFITHEQTNSRVVLFTINAQSHKQTDALSAA